MCLAMQVSSALFYSTTNRGLVDAVKKNIKCIFTGASTLIVQDNWVAIIWSLVQKLRDLYIHSPAYVLKDMSCVPLSRSIIFLC